MIQDLKNVKFSMGIDTCHTKTLQIWRKDIKCKVRDYYVWLDGREIELLRRFLNKGKEQEQKNRRRNRKKVKV